VRRFLLCCIVVLTARDAFGQGGIARIGSSHKCDRQEYVSEKEFRCIGNVEIVMDDTTLFADEVRAYPQEKRAVASGNVLYIQGNNRVAADRAEMDTETRLGTFFDAWGFANIQPQRQTAPVGGFVAPQLAGADTDIYFFGERIEKIGPKKYRITNGGFTTCVQPSPRWDLHAGTVLLNIDHYTLLRNVVFNVKNVPLFYLPILYYPTKEEGRATGFLLPTYGSTTIRGQQLSNAFFWAINRSQDATIKYDWFSKGDQGWNGEYRYAALTGDGTIEGAVLDQSGNEYSLPSRSFTLRGGLNQTLPGNFRARARVNYFSSLATNLTLHSNFYDASRNSRTYGGNVTGAWRGYSINATFDRSEYFSGTASSTLTGTAPRVAVTRGERPLYRNSAAYFSIGSEFVQFERGSRSGDIVEDSGLARFDLNPQIRYPFKRWQWFTVNSTVTWRNTFYTRSKIPGTETTTERLVGDDLNRQYVTLVAHTVGPVFNRVWNTPDNGYAERFKHAIEPFLTIQRTTPIANSDRIIRTDHIDSVVGNATNYTYGLNNRFYAKRRVGQTTQAQEIVSVDLRQSYYTDERSSQSDQQYITTGLGSAPSNFSPLSLGVRVVPAASLNASFRAEFDARHRELRSTSLSSSYNWTTRLQTSVGWNRRYFIEQLPEFANPDSLNHDLNVDTRMSTINNRFGGSYSMNFDVQDASMRQQRINAYYNAQCCGLAFEYQTFNYGARFSTPVDHRFFMSFTLAGLGNFSPFSGALANVPR
jgi:LPS-assembly protein